MWEISWCMWITWRMFNEVIEKKLIINRHEYTKIYEILYPINQYQSIQQLKNEETTPILTVPSTITDIGLE